ncbi:MAG TPA: glycosyltransferase [Steroidobacteraceae bacterium]|jgi:exo-beta-1,3-glucanase (GH17 family)/cellulose synthase/poly-beta-1,6-N-acetylglucosamine synthase-like glycosyltransferase|nr:glycosyltransferase [Steroidobacteraceae bacterium]
MKLFSGILVAAVFAVMTFGVWGYLNRPESEPPWPAHIQGVAFSPYAADQDPFGSKDIPSVEQIDSDLKLLATRTYAVRTYSVLGTLGRIPELAAKHNVSVALGVQLSRDKAESEEEMRTGIALANQHRNIVRVIVGNEVLLRGDLTEDELAAYLDRARAAIRQPVGYADTWATWLKNPEIARHVDFIGVHLFPYWEGVDVESAVDFCFRELKAVQAAYPKKPVIIAEIGWPSEGRIRAGAVASVSNEALFLRRFLARAEKEGERYYIMEAFDQPWKARDEGAVGAYWGIYDVDRQPKFEFVAPIVRIPAWHMLAAISVTLALLMLGVFYMHSGSLRTLGRTLIAIVVYSAATITVWVVYDYTQQYLTPTSVVVGSLLILGMLGVVAVLFAEAHEWAEAHWTGVHMRLFDPSRNGPASTRKVSVHLPAYNEPPDMLIETLDALARLNYPNYEVIVVDNNTSDEAVWRPVEAHCARLGERFRFYHVAPLAGFKAGALNYALSKTAADAQVVAVIDSDYMVEPDWLLDLVPAFDNPRIAIVQAPQDYRDENDNAFKAMCYAEYRGFFYIGMITRNERNAIIQHGTMTLVRRYVLSAVGGWAEWCITEDAELGLRVFEAGYEALYIARSYGRGLMPDTFIDYKRQRFRWAYGAMQILRHHAAALLRPAQSALTSGQRYHFIAGWLPWVADGFNLLFNIAAIGWSMAMILAPQKIDPPLMVFSVLPLSLFMFKLVKLVHLYTYRVGMNVRQTAAAAISGLALAHTIGRAVLKGLLTRNEPFFRTPKHSAPHRFVSAVGAAREETLFMIALWCCAIGIRTIPKEMASPDLTVWIAALLIQSIQYTAALLLSLTSAFNIPASLLGTSAGELTKPAAQA